jgi:hopanoid biosynthesis associated RND transporter like protein HpnN
LLSLIVGIVGGSRRFAPFVVLAALALAAAGLAFTAAHLRIDTDTNHLFAQDLPWRQAQIAEAKNFPQFDSLIVAVVRGATPEEATETAAALNAALNADRQDFHNSSYPANQPFYAQEGLLLLPVDQLAKLLNAIIAAQPFLGELAADPSARGLFDGLGLIAQGVQAGQANLTPYAAALNGVEQSLQQAADGRPEPLSWEALLNSDTGQQDAEFVLAHPVLNQGTLQPGGIATAALTRIAASLPDVKAGRATVDYTGQIPLSDEQFASLTQGLVVGGIVSVILIALWLYLALRSWRLILPIIATLLLGLCLTIGFAAVAIGVINLISVAFAILFIGLAVDFAIQFCVRLRDVRHAFPDLAAAIPETARQAGGQIALAATATACGFLAFAPTPFVGVAELGIIAGAGMFIAFFCTITFLPALLWLFRPRPESFAIGLPFGRQGDALLRRHRKPVLAVFAALALAGLFGAVTIGFDANPLDTKDPNTESMKTLSKLLDDPATNPFYADALAPNFAAANALAAKLRELPEVVGVISGGTFVPDQQPEKLAMIAQAQSILAPTLLAAQSPPPPVTAAAIRAAMQKAHDAILSVKNQLPPNAPLLGIAAAMGQLLGEDDARIMAMNAAITRFLPGELSRLNATLSPQPITRASLPPGIANDWFLPDGEVRVEALPTDAAQTTAGLKKFADAVLSVAPNAGGPAISTIATAGTILGSFREAAFLATVAIAVILFVVFRNLRDMALVLATLALSALLTALFARLDGLSINYANIIALPLLLGVGVSFNVYFVMNFRAGMQRFLSSATAHAVLFSALTTGTAFGTLAASHDRGTASMGILLLLSLLAVLISTFLFLPALLYALNAGKTQR